MDQRQENYMTMTRGVVAHFQNNKAVWEGIGIVRTVFGALQAVSENADSEAKKQSVTTTAHTRLKDELLEEMTELTYKASLKLSAYARIYKDTLLFSAVKLSRSALDEGTELEIAGRCSLIAGKLKEYTIKLKDFEVNEEDVTRLEKAIEAYRKAPALRDAVGGERKTASFNITASIKSLKESFKILDELVESLVRNDNFNTTYWNLRNIKQTGVGKTTAKLNKEPQLA